MSQNQISNEWFEVSLRLASSSTTGRNATNPMVHYSVNLLNLSFDLLTFTSVCSFLEGNQAHLAEEPVKASVGLSSLSHVAGQGNGLLLSGELASLIDVSNLDLDGGVIVSGDECVGGGTLSWNVQVDNLVLIVLHYQSRFIFKTIK